ncbi:MAG: NCS2 family permease [Candidatus Omnitrophica bacterium]|nr:NCS2 family permease [Candidatus Omnitrophota bacterium]
MKRAIEKFFRLKELNTDIRTEVLAGITTFMTMAYIIIVNPAILEIAGIPKGPSMVATILVAFFSTLFMGLYANRPFALAPYMGENAFVAFTVVGLLGYSWQDALTAIFLGGVIFTLLTVFRIRGWLANAIPVCLKYSFAVGIGLFLAFIGLNEAGIVVLGSKGAPVRMGNLGQPEVILAIIGFLMMGIFMIRKFKGSILLSIILVAIISFFLGISKFPDKLVSLPPSISPIFLRLDFSKTFTMGFLGILLTVFILDFVDTIGTIIGVSARAGFLDKDGNLPQIEKPLLVDALSTVLASILGTTTAGTFIESASGIEEGGRSGLTASVTAGLFLLALFFSPLLSMIPKCAYAPALIIVGLLMLEPIRRINFYDYTEIIPAFSVVTLMCFTYNIGVGITAGFVLYLFFKLISGRFREITAGTWVLGILSLFFFIFYPY